MENTENRVRAAARRFKGFGTQQTRLIIVRTVRLAASCSRIVHCRGCFGKIGRGMLTSWLASLSNNHQSGSETNQGARAYRVGVSLSWSQYRNRVRIVRISSLAISYDPVATAPGN